jgi:hypothetical protein
MSVQLQGVRFAEIADMVLPHVGSPMLAVYDAPASIRPAPGTIDDRRIRAIAARSAPVAAYASASVSGFSPVAPIALIASGAPIAPVAPGAPIAPIAPIAPVAPVAPELSARAYSGAYSRPTLPDAAPAEQAGAWRTMAAPGIEIASAARKTGVGVATAITRVGVSLARSF